MAHDRERSKQRKTQDSDRDSTRFAEAAGEGVSGNEVFGLDRVDTARRSERRRPEDSATWSGTASPEERPVHKDMINNPENFDAASRSTGGVDASPREDVSRGAGSDNASSSGPSSFYGRARQRRTEGDAQRRVRMPRAGREEDMSMPSAQDIARGYGVDRNDFYGSRSSYTLGAETDADFARRAEAESPYYGDNLGAGADYGSEGSDLGPGIGANRAFGYGAAPSFGSMSPRDSASSIGYDVGYGPPAFSEHATLRGRPATAQSRVESHRGAPSRTQQGGRPQPRETGRGSRASGDYPEA
ncbi:MAG TPA: hypothetical protein VF166_01550, partial [Gemmatimonadaceae bacterium]